MRILGIETSCDETAVAILEASGSYSGSGDFSCTLLGNALFSQASMHAQFGGVFPNMAKREHAKNLTPLLEAALKEASLSVGSGHGSVISGEKIARIEKILEREPEAFAHLSLFLAQHEVPDIDCIAVTYGPGLEPALWVGVNFAKSLAVAWDKPLIGVNHMEGHIVSSLLRIEGPNALPIGKVLGFEACGFPALSLLISGGHTELILMKEFGSYEYLGRTRDDAVGEAFDKVARHLGLSYPGGPEISRLAEYARKESLPTLVTLPRPMMHEDNYEFSFAGLKTAVERYVQSNELQQLDREKIAREFEDAVSDVLVYKCKRAAEEWGAQTLIVGGGVSANKHIRSRIGEVFEHSGTRVLMAPLSLTGDNAAMIALAGYFRAQKKEFASVENLSAIGNLKLASL